MRLEELVIPLNVDKSGFTGGINNATKMITDFAKVAAVAVAAAAVVVGKFLLDSTKLASDLSETVSKVGIVFGDSANEIMDWAKTSATAMGMSKNSALAAAATYGNLFRAMGITEKTSAKMSKGLVNLAGDLASFNNMNPTEVLDKLRAGLAGETEPLRTLGVNLNQALIEERALELGLWDGVDAIDAAAKAQASYSLILEQTTLAQGDFARTADGLANQQRILAAQWEDLKTTLGVAFLPIFTKVVSKFNEFIKILADPAGLDVGKIVAWADNAIASFTKGLGDSINNWVLSGGPEEFSENLISWIEGIGDSEAIKSKTQIAMEHLVAAIGNALQEVDWSSIGKTFDDKLTSIIDNTDWVGIGSKFGEALDKAFATDIEVGELPTSVEAFGHAIDKFFQGATGADKFGGWKNFFDEWGRQTVEGQKRYWSLFGALTATEVEKFFTNLRASFIDKVKSLDVAIGDGLTKIAKTFFNRAAGWGAQMLQGFAGSQGALLSSIAGMVGQINGILRKIITAFTITIKLPSWLGGGDNPIPPTGGGGGGGGGNKRASGGPVIGGQAYSVAEFFRPEVFTPNASGRVDPMQLQTVTATIDEARLARTIVTALMQAGWSG